MRQDVKSAPREGGRIRELLRVMHAGSVQGLENNPRGYALTDALTPLRGIVVFAETGQGFSHEVLELVCGETEHCGHCVVRELVETGSRLRLGPQATTTTRSQ